MIAMRGIRWTTAAILLVLVTACTQSRVQTTESYLGPPMPRPDRVLVSYFSISPEQVRLDQGIEARVQRAAAYQSISADETQAAQATQAGLADRLVERLRRYGLPATLATTESGPGRSLLIQGQIIRINQGNRTRRMLIGLGAGRSSVTAATQIYYHEGTAPPRFMTAFEGEGDSGSMPGAAETMGAGAAAQRAASSAVLTGATHAGAETRHTSDTAEADTLADKLAQRIGQLAVAQGWISQTALQ